MKNKQNHTYTNTIITPKPYKRFIKLVSLLVVVAMVSLMLGSCVTNSGSQGQPQGQQQEQSNNGNSKPDGDKKEDTTKVALTIDTVSDRVVKASVEGDVQYLVTTVQSTSYQPVLVRKGVPVKWIMNATEEDLNFCNNAIMLPQYGIELALIAGENIIEFIPDEAGTFYYCCWMEMISAVIYVADADGSIPPMRPEMETFISQSPCCFD